MAKRRPDDPEDAHPLLGIVKDEHRAPFKKRLVAWGLDPQAMRPMLTVRDLRTRGYMESILASIVSDIRAHYPQIQSNLSPKYNESFSALEAQIPYLRTLVRAHLHETESFASLLLLVIGAGGLGGFIAWQSFSQRRRRFGARPLVRQAA